MIPPSALVQTAAVLIDDGKLCAFKNGGAMLFEGFVGVRRDVLDCCLRVFAREKTEEPHQRTDVRARDVSPRCTSPCGVGGVGARAAASSFRRYTTCSRS